MNYEFIRPNKDNVNLGDFLVFWEEEKRGRGRCFLTVIDDVGELNVGAKYKGEYRVQNITIGYDYIIILKRDGRFLVGKEVLTKGLEGKVSILRRIIGRK